MVSVCLSRSPACVVFLLSTPGLPRQTWKLLTLHQAMTCRKALRRTRCRGAGPAPEAAIKDVVERDDGCCVWPSVPYFSSGARALGHRQCMEILVRQDCEQKCRKEHLEELKHKLREETQRRRAFSAVMKLPA